VIEGVFDRISRNGLALDINVFYMMHNIDGRYKENTNANIEPLVDMLLDQKIGQLDDLIQNTKKKQEKEYPLPQITTNGLIMEDTKEIKEDNKLLQQIEINTVKQSDTLELKENKFKKSTKLRIKPMNYYYSSESSDEEEEEENISDGLEELQELDNGNIQLHVENKKKYKVNPIRYKDRFWNELANMKNQTYALDILFLYGDIDKNQLERTLTNYHGILAFTIQQECLELFQNAVLYEGEYYDLITTISGINVDGLINTPNIKADVTLRDKKWKILKFKTDKNYDKLIKMTKTIKKFNWPKFDFEEININFDKQMYDIN